MAGTVIWQRGADQPRRSGKDAGIGRSIRGVSDPGTDTDTDIDIDIDIDIGTESDPVTPFTTSPFGAENAAANLTRTRSAWLRMMVELCRGTDRFPAQLALRLTGILAVEVAVTLTSRARPGCAVAPISSFPAPPPAGGGGYATTS